MPITPPLTPYKSYVLAMQSRIDDSIAEADRALELSPVIVNAYESIGNDYMQLGQFEKSLEFYDKAIRLSPHDPLLHYWYQGKTGAHFGLKQYDQWIEWARRAIAINANNLPYAHAELIADLALTGRDAEARVALQSYLALQSDRTGDDRGLEGAESRGHQSANQFALGRILGPVDRGAGQSGHA